MRKRIRTEGIVLSRDVLGESDRLVTILTIDRGKMKAVAHGARRSRRRFAGCLELFARLELILTEKGAGKLARLEEATLLDPHEPIKSNLAAIAQASYLAELVLSLLPEGDEAREVYGLLSRALRKLEDGPLGAWHLRQFELQTLQLSGLAPNLDACIGCGTNSSEGWQYDHRQGGLVCTACAPGAAPDAKEPLTREVLDTLRGISSGSVPLGDAGSESVAQARRLLAHIIDGHVGRPLKAREFLRQLAKKG